MIKAIILMLVFVSMVQSEDTAPTGVTYSTWPELSCGGEETVIATPALTAIETATNAASCKNGVVTYLTNKYTKGECTKTGAAASAKMSWTAGCVASTSSGSAEAAATAFVAIGALAFL